MVFTDWPSTVLMASFVIPMVACTWLMEDSKFAAVATAAVPRPVTAAVTGSIFSPTEEMASPVVFNFSPVAEIFCKAVAEVFACSSNFFKSCSVSMISLCRASYCSLLISPLARAVLACSAAVFKVSSFSLVSLTASAKSFSFCARSSVFPGSSFRSFSLPLAGTGCF